MVRLLESRLVSGGSSVSFGHLHIYGTVAYTHSVLLIPFV